MTTDKSIRLYQTVLNKRDNKIVIVIRIIRRTNKISTYSIVRKNTVDRIKRVHMSIICNVFFREANDPMNIYDKYTDITAEIKLSTVFDKFIL